MPRPASVRSAAALTLAPGSGPTDRRPSAPTRHGRALLPATLILVVGSLLGVPPAVTGRDVTDAPAPALASAHRAASITTAAAPDGADTEGTAVSDAVSIVGQIGGSATAVTLDGETLYAGIGPRVVILDASGGGAPREIGRSPVLPSVVQAIVADGGIVFAASTAGLSIIDASEPGSARIVAHVPGIEPTLRAGWGLDEPRVALSGSIAYFAPTSWAPLQVLDVSDPSRPVELATLPSDPSSGLLQAIAAVGDTLYLARSGTRSSSIHASIAVFDMRDPTAPVPLGSTMFGNVIIDSMIAVGHVLLLSRGGCDLEVLDATDPMHLESLGCSRWDAGDIRRIVNHGSEAFLLDDRSAGIWIVDWSEPRAPTLVAYFYRPASDLAVDASGDRWFAAESSGLLTYRAVDRLRATPSSEIEVNDIRPTGWAYDGGRLAVVGDVVLAGVSGGTRVYRIDDGDALVHASGIPVEITSRPVAVGANVALLAQDGVVHAYDVSEPSAPRSLGRYDAPGAVHTMAVTGTLVVVAGAIGRDTGFAQLLDYSDPAAPERLDGHADLDLPVDALAVEGDRLYLSHGGRLEVWDVSRPDAVAFVTSVRATGLGFDHLVARGGYVYGAERRRLSVFDARASGEIREVFTTQVLARWYFEASGLSFIGDHLIMPWRNTSVGAWLFDVRDPAIPRPAGLIGAGGSIGDLVVSGDRVLYLYRTDRYSGSEPLRLRIARVSGALDVRLVARHPAIAFAAGAFLDGDLAYVTGWPGGLWIVDTADPGDPRRLGSVTLPNGADWVVVQDGHAYVVTQGHDEAGDTLRVIDVSDPERPEVVSTMLRDGPIRDLTVEAGRLYLVEPDGLTIFDVRSDPRTPLELGRLASGADDSGRSIHFWHVAATGGRAVLANSVTSRADDGRETAMFAELRVVDVSDPANPVVTGVVGLGVPSVRGLDLAWPRAFALVSPGVGLKDIVYVVDVGSAEGPRIDGIWHAPHATYGASIAVAGELAFIGSWFGVMTLDLPAALDPQTAGLVFTPGRALYTTRFDADEAGRIALANGDAGLVLLTYDRDRLPEPTPGPSPTRRPLPTASSSPPAPTEISETATPGTSTTPTPVSSVPPGPAPAVSIILLPWVAGTVDG